MDEQGLIEHLVAEHAARVVILYGSAARGQLGPESDIDVVCFREGPERHPLSYHWRGLLLDAWIHPLSDAEDTRSFFKLGGGRVLVDSEGRGQKLLDRVDDEIRRPPEALDPHEERHRRAWVWKMLARARRSGPEGDYRRHWLRYDLLPLRHRARGDRDRGRAMLRRPELTAIAACGVALACTSTQPPSRVVTTRVEPVASSEPPDVPPPGPRPSPEEQVKVDRPAGPPGSAWQEAERNCEPLPDDLEGACIDAEIKRQGAAIYGDLADNVRALELLDELGQKACSNEPDPIARKACELSAMNQALTELESSCDGEPEEQRHPCLVRKLIEKYGP